MKVIFCKLFFSGRATAASKIVNTNPVHFQYKVILRQMAIYLSDFLANQKARNAIVGDENLLIKNSYIYQNHIKCIFKLTF